jgi:hypothetical protein
LVRHMLRAKATCGYAGKYRCLPKTWQVKRKTAVWQQGRFRCDNN